MKKSVERWKDEIVDAFMKLYLSLNKNFKEKALLRERIRKYLNSKRGRLEFVKVLDSIKRINRFNYQICSKCESLKTAVELIV